ncbi:MAG TPA: hypothetical protein VJZ00_05770 [Thermoanaerobaculia bacterium]|nr:hypothetical protein [Thermoanaerobaculia bacterium]
MTLIQKSDQWPRRPYKGLSYYGPDDVLLFAGRDVDVTRCAMITAQPGTRVTILHGGTGCGKSSFLRAGLIPYLESRGRGFRFLKNDESRAIFIRSTATPLANLGEEMIRFAARERHIETPDGETQIVTIPLEATWRHSRNPAQDQVRALSRIAAAVSETLVVVIDQAEEVLTLNAGQEGLANRNDFFNFIAEFSRSSFDLKLLIAIRTEYYGRYRHAIQEAGGDMGAIAEFFLDDLSDSELVDAILRPTLEEDVAGMGSPRERYGFVFEDGLPQRIVKDLRKANLTGGILPVTQIICDALYDKLDAFAIPTRVIRAADYEELGTLEDQVERHLEQVLAVWCRQNSVRVSVETDAWKNILADLARAQVDGTVTTELVPAAELETVAEKERTRLPFSLTMDYLENEAQRIVRRVNVMTPASEEPVVCYSLGHDVLGLPLLSWRRDASRFDMLVLMARSLIFIYALVFLVPFVIDLLKWKFGSGPAPLHWEAVFQILPGVLLAVMAFVVKRHDLERPLLMYARALWPLLPVPMKSNLMKNRRFMRMMKRNGPLWWRPPLP